MNELNSLKACLAQNADPVFATELSRFFKTGPGDYSEGDIFCGIRTPILRKIIIPFIDLPLDDIAQLLASPIHEERMSALFILVAHYKKKNTPDAEKKQIYDFYMTHTKGINNWDLVDASAAWIPGDWLFDKSRAPLFAFARSKNMWQRRIAIVATHEFIRRNDYTGTFTITDILLHDEHDLIHKAAGWMLREVGKRNLAAEEDFLKSRYQEMPRTMLRYAIEKFPETKRKKYLQGKI